MGTFSGQPNLSSSLIIFFATTKFFSAALRLAYTIGGSKLSLRAILYPESPSSRSFKISNISGVMRKQDRVVSLCFVAFNPC